MSPEPDSDRILAPQLQGTAKRHAKWRDAITSHLLRHTFGTELTRKGVKRSACI